MKLIGTKKYKGFEAKFFVLPKTEKFLNENKINLKDYIPSTKQFFELCGIFDFLGKEYSKNWNPEETDFKIMGNKMKPKSIKKFKIIYYGIIEKWKNNTPQGFVEKFEYDKRLEIDDGYIYISYPINPNIDSIGIRQKILIS